MEPLIVTARTHDDQTAALRLAAGALSNGMKTLVAPYPDQGQWIESRRKKPLLMHNELRLRLGGAAGCRTSGGWPVPELARSARK